MKKFFTIALIFALTGALYAQKAERLTLLEHFTSAGCGPCASSNPALQALLNTNSDKVISIKYQVLVGFDPMYYHNTEDVSARASLYNVSSVPNSVFDGNQYNGHPSGMNQTRIDNRARVESPLSISVSHQITPGYDTIKVQADITAHESVESSNLKAYIVVVEEKIEFEEAPGSNGETEFFNVMKKILPSGNGQSISPAQGSTLSLEDEWELANVYDDNRLGVVVFVQDNSTKEVIQAGYSPAYPLNQYDAEIVSVSNPKSTFCGESVAPQIKIKNNGEGELTELNIDMKINGESATTYQWTGSLPFGESQSLTLPEFSFEAQPENTLEIWVSQPNGNTDQRTENDSISLDFQKIETTSQLELHIKTDNYGSETTWEVKNSAGQTLYDGGPYTDNSRLYTYDLNLPAGDCYSLFVYDSYGDGMHAGYGEGYYQLYDSYGSLILSGGDFGQQASEAFGVTPESSAIGEIQTSESLSVFPNPFSEKINIEFVLNENLPVSFQIFNLLGEKIYEQNSGILPQGIHRTHWNAQNFPQGIYFLRLKAGKQTFLRKLILEK